VSDEVQAPEGAAEETTEEVSYWAGMAQLPDEYKKDEDIAKLGGFGELAREYKELKGKVQDIPEIPESPDGYELEAPGDLPEGYEPDDTAAELFKKKAHELKLSKEQAKGMQQLYNELALSDYEQQKTKTTEELKKGKEVAERELRKKYGDEYTEKMELARRTIHGLIFGDQELTEDLVKNNALLQKIDRTIGNEPEFIELFIKIAEANREDSFLKSDGRTSTGVNLDKLYPTMKGVKISDY